VHLGLADLADINIVVYAGFLTFIYGAIKGLSRWNPETGVRVWLLRLQFNNYLANVFSEMGPITPTRATFSPLHCTVLFR
jgi:hypothetical protein